MITITPARVEPTTCFPHPAAVALARTAEGYHAMLAATHALNPTVPMPGAPGAVQPNFDIALKESTLGLTAIRQALESYPVIRNEARTALESALVDAKHGHDLLVGPRPLDARLGFVRDRVQIGAAFESAATWLARASTLLQAELGATLPTDPNAAPTPVQLPSPDSSIQ
ncbi:MAG: hypothetical protein JWN72_950 [Thermoleophilia bacterium]|nr:hypothetical protein [Thermoleophilia bacterium]